VTGVFMDITAAKQAELEADLQRREVAHLMRVSVMGELSGAIAHELNQPLTAILSNAQAARLMLAGKPPHLSTIGDAIDDIVHESKRAGDVIGRLHGLLKKGDRKLELVDLNELIRSTIGLLHSELVGRRFRADLDLAEKLPPIAGDAVQLQQVLLNLVMNAMDAMAATPPARRSITVSTRLRGKDGVETVVADHGQGLAPAEQARAFEPFFTTKPHGLGLGLAICSTIVGLHGGQLALANNPGGGARATLTLQGRRNPVIAT
jgi:C4-dicarboxylate-specific signal transduction histidine kinase